MSFVLEMNLTYLATTINRIRRPSEGEYLVCTFHGRITPWWLTKNEVIGKVEKLYGRKLGFADACLFCG